MARNSLKVEEKAKCVGEKVSTNERNQKEQLLEQDLCGFDFKSIFNSVKEKKKKQLK